MAYQPLARKYRPETFLDLVGQDSVACALSNAVRLDREPCGVIFSGIRGVGKTTLARIFAKSLNCDQGKTPEPCGTCYSCKAISGGYHEDVLEIDGASNNGVSEVRALQETTTYTPQRSQYRVYIIDEVHMLSTSAFNALLKTLEEPPDNVVFIFATTELQKLPRTVVGRCQTFHLRKISNQDVQQRLKTILDKEKIECEEAVLQHIAREGQGSMRDALSLLDQFVALGLGKLSSSLLSKISSHICSQQYIDFVGALVEKDSQKCISLIQTFSEYGIEYESLSLNIASMVRHAMLLKQLGSKSDKVLVGELSSDETKSLFRACQNISVLELSKIFHWFTACIKEFDNSSIDRFILENYCIEWCLSPNYSHNQKAETVTNQRAVEPKEQVQVKPQEAQKPEIETPKNPSLFPDTWTDLIVQMKKVRPIQGRKLEEVHPLSYSKDLIKVAVDPTSFVGEALLKPEVQLKIAHIFLTLFKFSGKFVAVDRNLLVAESKGETLSETQLMVKQREKSERHIALEKEALNHPLTKALVEEMGAKVINTRVHN